MLEPMDPVARFLAAPTVHRALRVALFLGLVVAFARLLPLLAAFAVTGRVLTWTAPWLARRTGWSDSRTSIITAATGVLLCVLGVWGAWTPASAWLAEAWAGLPALYQDFMRHPLVQRAIAELGGESAVMDTILEGHAATNALAGTLAVGGTAAGIVLKVVMGALLALVHVGQRDALARMMDGVDAHGVLPSVARWVGHLGDGFALTVQLQVIVAVCNTLTTIPVMLFMGVPHIPAMALVIFVLALVPTLGNYVAAVILSIVAWGTAGWVALPVFLGLATVLGKVEGFWLAPRLAARHVDVPAFILLVSLVLWESAFGILGLFLSFPALYTILRIRSELRSETLTATPDPTPILSTMPLTAPTPTP